MSKSTLREHLIGSLRSPCIGCVYKSKPHDEWVEPRCNNARSVNYARLCAKQAAPCLDREKIK